MNVPRTGLHHRRHVSGSSSRIVARCPGSRSGSLLLEALIAIGVFSIFLAGIGLALVLGERTTIAAGDHARGSLLALQQIDAVRSMRLDAFSSVSPGIHGLVETPGGWTFSGAEVVRSGYHTAITVTSRAADWIEVTANASWNFGQTRSGSTTLTTYLTDWRKTFPVGNWATMTKIGEATMTGTPEFQQIAVAGDYAYITSSIASGGKGLYVFDIANPAYPVQVASTFDLGASAYGLAVSGDRLYLATDNPVQEIQVYDISSPATLAAGNLVNSFDLAGEGKARSIAIYGETIFVGAMDNPPNPQFSSIQMSETGPMSLLGSLEMNGSVLALSLRDGYAYAATANNAGELEVIDIFDPAHPEFAPGIGMDLPDVQDATAILTTGTSALIGRSEGDAIDEAILYSVADAPVPSPPPGPWPLEIGGNVLGLASTYGNLFAFLASDSSASQLRVLSLTAFERGESPVVKTFDAHASVLSLAYDWTNDRLFAVTPDSLLVFAPGT